MFLYDNNRDGEDNLLDEISDFVDDGFVTIIPWKTGKGFFQNDAQYDCYHRRGGGYDWIAFIDSDEYLQILEGDIHSFIENEIFNDADAIEIGSVNYTDTGIIVNNTKNRLGIYTDINYNMSQRMYKAIIRTGNDNIYEFNHFPRSNSDTSPKLIDADGRIVPPSDFVIENTTAAHIDHFPTGCIDDYIHRKSLCGWPDENNRNNWGIEEFYYFNYYGKEKDDYWNNYIEKRDKMYMAPKKTDVVPKKLIFFIYVGDTRSPRQRIAENKTAALHFKCLKRYRKVFDEARFIISFKKELIAQQTLFGEYVNFIHSLGYGENTEYVMEVNTEVRESKSFEREIVNNDDNEGKMVFFGHLRGEQYDNDSLRKWVFSNYYFALEDVESVKNALSVENKVFYGFPFADCRESELKSWEIVPKYKYYYLGTEFWINISLLKEAVRCNGNNYPKIFGRFYSENFPASVCPIEKASTFSETPVQSGYWLYDQFDEMFTEWCGRAYFNTDTFYNEFNKINDGE